MCRRDSRFQPRRYDMDVAFAFARGRDFRKESYRPCTNCNTAYR